MSTRTPHQPVWQIVARREIAVRATDKSTLIGTAVMLAVIVGVLGFTAWNEGKEKTYDIAYSSASAQAMVDGIGERASGIEAKVHVDPVSVDDAEAARTALEDERIDAYLRPTSASDPDSGWTLVTLEDADSELRDVVTQAVAAIVLADNAAAAGTTSADLTKGSKIALDQVEGDSELSAIRFVVGYALAIVFYFASIMFGMTLANSVVEEKQSRIVEMIAAAVPLRQLLAGKIIGNAVIAVGQMLVYVSVGLIGMSFTDFSFALPALSGAIGWFVIFFLIGFVVLSTLWAVAGALASRTEDLQSSSTPITMLLMVMFFGALYLDGVGEVIGSYVPPLSAVLMPMRLIDGTAAWWEPVIAIVLLMGFGAALIGLAERLYSRALLQTGGQLSLKAAWRLEE
ncbi:ABC-2 type transport system permease protein [Nocardioides albertanoniae]|uniref:ABC-2 type transport system permease protein n=1 Tax=Nocardioides albertanoniae TaxID=1175486 RepID=A0A543A6K9_9ACTN|nr:ABC transporter permease [Nocardioides albertanoniae]TQL68242.1 ABC-2 type transport system permease protein [Nocardioides albertanoniae]